jgi:hypothetical protein
MIAIGLGVAAMGLAVIAPARMSRRYCSPRCRQRAYRARAATA